METPDSFDLFDLFDLEDLMEFDPDARQIREEEPSTRLTHEEVSWRWAYEISNQFGWEESGERLLRELLECSGNPSATSRRLIELVEEEGVCPDELSLLFELRQRWEELVLEESKLPWSTALDYLRSFRGIPSMDELLLDFNKTFELAQKEAADYSTSSLGQSMKKLLLEAPNVSDAFDWWKDLLPSSQEGDRLERQIHLSNMRGSDPELAALLGSMHSTSWSGYQTYR